jgi:hypothetical protein
VRPGQTRAGKVQTMSAPIEPASDHPYSFMMTAGLDVLDEWSASAVQSQRNIVYRILFAIADKTAFCDYIVLNDVRSHMEFFVLAKSDLVVKFRLEDFESFSVLYIGPACTAPGLDLALSVPVPDSAEADDSGPWG